MTRLSVHETGMQLIRRRGTTTGSPEFIAAYLAEEHRRQVEKRIAIARQMVQVTQVTEAAIARINEAMRIAASAAQRAMEPFRRLQEARAEYTLAGPADESSPP